MQIFANTNFFMDNNLAVIFLLQGKRSRLFEEIGLLRGLIDNAKAKLMMELGGLLNEYIQYAEKRQESTYDNASALNLQMQSFFAKSPNIVDEIIDKELKAKYREAAKLCHPDKATYRDFNSANVLFVKLKDAYDRRDIIYIVEWLEDHSINEELKSDFEVIQGLNTDIAWLKSIINMIIEDPINLLLLNLVRTGIETYIHQQKQRLEVLINIHNAF
jgi:hypothetical protein